MNNARDVSDAILRRMMFALELRPPTVRVRARIWARQLERHGIEARPDEAHALAAEFEATPGVAAGATAAARLGGGDIAAVRHGVRSLSRVLSCERPPQTTPARFDPGSHQCRYGADSDGTVTDTAAVIVAGGGAEGDGVGVPVWEARWSSTGSGGCTAFSIGVVNAKFEETPAEDEQIAVTLHVDRQRSMPDDQGMEVKDASATILERHPFSPNIHRDGAWVYVVGTTADALSTVMTVEPAGTDEQPCDGSLVAWVYVNRWLAARNASTMSHAHPSNEQDGMYPKMKGAR